MLNVDFLSLPPRTEKPRESGLTMAIDRGMSVEQMADILAVAEPLIDCVKFGWGTGLVTTGVERKIALLQETGIDVWFGGTLFEICYEQGKLDNLLAWIHDLGVRTIEISDGTITLEPSVKTDLISRLAKDMRVVSEVGSKDIEHVMPPSQWISCIHQDLEAGAWKVIAEGRESGRAGIYRRTGEVRAGLIEELITSDLDIDNIIFEAPQREQQAWFVCTFGANVNLGNIQTDDIIGLETLRLGLRSDTMGDKGPNSEWR